MVFIGSYLFCHLTPEKAIRTDLFFSGYIVGALKTEVFISNEAPWKDRYFCKNPGIGPDFIAVRKGELGLWYIDYKNSGGG